MKHHPDDSTIRSAFRELVREDRAGAPSFDEVLERWSAVSAGPFPVVRVALVLGCLCAVVAGSVLWWNRAPTRDDLGATVDRRPEPSRPVKMDERVRVALEEMRLAVDRHFDEVERSAPVEVVVWSSRTESLLSISLEEPMSQE